MPDKIFGLTLFLDFFDRGTQSPCPASATYQAGRDFYKVNNAKGVVGMALLRCPIFSAAHGGALKI